MLVQLIEGLGEKDGWGFSGPLFVTALVPRQFDDSGGCVSGEDPAGGRRLGDWLVVGSGLRPLEFMRWGRA